MRGYWSRLFPGHLNRVNRCIVCSPFRRNTALRISYMDIASDRKSVCRPSHRVMSGNVAFTTWRTCALSTYLTLGLCGRTSCVRSMKKNQRALSRKVLHAGATFAAASRPVFRQRRDAVRAKNEASDKSAQRWSQGRQFDRKGWDYGS
jgi:hypothetical protein